MGKKYNLEKVKEFAESKGYEVLDNEYIEVKAKMHFKCKKCNHVVETSFDCFKNHSTCMSCRQLEVYKKWDNILNQILELSKEKGRSLRIDELIDLKIISDSKLLNKYLKNKTIYKDYKDFYRQNGYKIGCDVEINNKIISVDKLEISDLVILFDEYKDKYGDFPTSSECKNINNLPSWGKINDILNENNMTIQDFYLKIDHNCGTVLTKDENYYYFIDKFKNICKKLHRVIRGKELNHKNDFDLPSPQWFIEHCPDKNVKSYPDFLHWLGYVNRFNMTKEEATKIIYDMQSKLNRPLMYDDFRNPTDDTVGITIIKKYWSTMNKMKAALGLIVNQEDMCHRTPTIEETKVDIKNVCNKIYSEDNRKMITSKDINNNCPVRVETYIRVLKRNNNSLRNYISSLGFKYQQEGNGLNYFFKDGEKVRSQYELDFSKFLRSNLNLKYNVDYYRDVKYKDFIKDYNENMDCDYIIHCNSRIIYIEIVGMLRDYKKNWKTVKLNSKSKTKYIEHLKQKEQMFIDNNLDYYILFPSDLKDENNILSIFNNENKLHEKGID